jgi:hypothetical protein
MSARASYAIVTFGCLSIVLSAMPAGRDGKYEPFVSRLTDLAARLP